MLVSCLFVCKLMNHNEPKSSLRVLTLSSVQKQGGTLDGLRGAQRWSSICGRRTHMDIWWPEEWTVVETDHYT